MPFKFIHLANLNSTNIGNGALIFGAERVLGEDSKVPIEWMREPWDDYTFGLKPFDQAFVDLVNSSDGLIVNGAVTMNGAVYYGNTGMRLDLPLDLWHKIKKPLIFYGISHRYWDGQIYHHLDLLRKVLDFAINSAGIFLGVRNDGTKDWIEHFVGVKSRRIVEIPDSGLFVPPDITSEYPEFQKDRCNIILAFNNEDAQQRYGNTEKRAGVVQAIVRVIETLAEERPLQVILVPHYFDDYKMMSEFVDRIKPRLAHQCTVSTGLCRISRTRLFYGRYIKADLIISMRIHSMSPAIGMGLPVVPLVSQDRMRYFLRNAGLSDLAVDVSDESMQEALLAAARRALMYPAVLRERYAAACQAFRVQIKEVNRQIYEIIGGV